MLFRPYGRTCMCYKPANFRPLSLFHSKDIGKNRFLDFVFLRIWSGAPSLALPSGLIYSAIWVKVYATLG